MAEYIPVTKWNVTHCRVIYLFNFCPSSKGVKRVTLVRDPQKGIGCTIKNAAGHILVNRIIEDGPIAISGVLRPGNCPTHPPHHTHH